MHVGLMGVHIVCMCVRYEYTRLCVWYVTAWSLCAHCTHVGTGLACVWCVVCDAVWCARPGAMHCAPGMCVRCVQVHPCAGVVWVCAASAWSWARCIHASSPTCTRAADTHGMHRGFISRAPPPLGTDVHTADTRAQHTHTCAHCMQMQTPLHASPIPPRDTHGHRTHSHAASTRTPHSTRRHRHPQPPAAHGEPGLAQTQHVHAEVKGLRTCAVRAGPLPPEDICPCSCLRDPHAAVWTQLQLLPEGILQNSG